MAGLVQLLLLQGFNHLSHLSEEWQDLCISGYSITAAANPSQQFCLIQKYYLPSTEILFALYRSILSIKQELK